MAICNRVHVDRKAGGNPSRYFRRRGKKLNWKGESHAGRGHISGRVDILKRLLWWKERSGLVTGRMTRSLRRADGVTG